MTEGTRLHTTVQQKIKEIKENKYTNDVEKLLQDMEIGDKKKEKNKGKTIKEKLQKGLYDKQTKM